MNRLLDKMASHPRLIFLADGSGALLTVALLLGVLRTFSALLGLPASAIDKLALIAVGFAIYSFSCFFFARHEWRVLLKIIASANLLYCCLTASLLVLHRESVTPWAWTYFSIEIVVVTALAIFELKMATKPVSH